MSATAIFPLALWQEGTNQNSTPANDNALRIEALFGPANGIADSAPASPDDHDQWIVGTAWGGHVSGNIVINLGGTWKEFATYDGMTKLVDGEQYFKASGTWSITPAWVSVPANAAASGLAGQLAYDATHLYACVAPDTWVRAALSTW